jgi:hypothetical protein
VSTNDARRDADYSRSEDAQVRAVRRDAEDDQPIQVAGYVPGTDRARAFPGDEKFPFVKDVPDVTGPDEYRKSVVKASLVNPLPFAATLGDYETLPEIDIRGSRGLVLMGIYVPGSDLQLGGQGLLSVICEASLEPFAPTTPSLLGEVWVPIGVVDPTLRTPAIQPGFAYRNFFSSEFRLDPWVGYVAPPFPTVPAVVFTLVFDVSWYRKVRFRVAELAPGQQLPVLTYLDLRYFRQR